MSNAPLESVIASLGKLTQNDFNEVIDSGKSHDTEELGDLVMSLIAIAKTSDLKFIPVTNAFEV